jgi:hypothetical protein
MNAADDPIVTALLCDAAQVSGDKLYVLGGGWAYLWGRESPASAQMALAVTLSIPWSRANERLSIETRLVTEDGEQVTQEFGEVRASGEVEAGRPAGARRGAPSVVPFVVTFGGLLLEYGGYVWEVEVDNVVRARVPFQVAAPPGMPPPSTPS